MDMGYWAMTALATLLGVFGIRTEEQPRYEVVRAEGAVEIRAYAPQLVVETAMSGMDNAATGEAFSRLAGYIFGANAGTTKVAMTAPVTMESRPEKIAMTAPVTMQPRGEAMVMRFVVPSRFTADTVPRPTDPAIRVRELPAETLATWRFRGRLTPENVREAEASLREWMAAQGYEPAGPARVAGYDSPFAIPLLRRSEVMIPVAQAQPKRPVM